MSSEGSKYNKYNKQLEKINVILKKNKKDISDDDITSVVNTTMNILKELTPMYDKDERIRTDNKFTKNEQFEMARKYLEATVKNTINKINNNYELLRNAYKYTLKENPFNTSYDDKRGDIFALISNHIFLSSVFDNKDLKPSLSASVKARNTRSDAKAAINKYYKSIEDEEIENIRKENENIRKEIEKYNKEIEKIKNDKLMTDKEKDERIAEIGEERDKALKGVKIAKEGFDYVLYGIKDIKDNSKVQNAALGELLKKNKSDILNDVALRLAGDPDLKKNIRKIKGDLKASNPNYSDGDINYIITKALYENDRYLKTVAANPDLFDRDMSNDTIQKENEQFQSKLRQQNLRYILPKFIERREKLVENTLNPELLKGAFAI